MGKRTPYWITDKPSDAKRWEGCELGAVLDNKEFRDQLFKVHRRYAKQWNDIELDDNRSLAEHTHQICGAKVIGSSNRFILRGGANRDENWILEVAYARGFKQYYPGLSTGLNAMRSAEDIRSIRLHWRERGREAFDTWLAHEHASNSANGEWMEYRS